MVDDDADDDDEDDEDVGGAGGSGGGCDDDDDSGGGGNSGGPPQVALPHVFEQAVVKGYRRTAEAVCSPPWNMLRGKAFLEELCDVYGAKMTIQQATELACMPPPTFVFTQKIKSSLGTLDELPEYLKEELASGNIHDAPVRVITIGARKRTAAEAGQNQAKKAKAKPKTGKRPAAAVLRRPAAATKRLAAATKKRPAAALAAIAGDDDEESSDETDGEAGGAAAIEPVPGGPADDGEDEAEASGADGEAGGAAEGAPGPAVAPAAGPYTAPNVPPPSPLLPRPPLVPCPTPPPPPLFDLHPSPFHWAMLVHCPL